MVFVVDQVELSHHNAELRLIEVFYHKIYKVPVYFWASQLVLYCKFIQNLLFTNVIVNGNKCSSLAFAFFLLILIF